MAARGQVHVDAPEDERERLQSIGEVLGNAVLVRGLETLGQAVVDMRGTDAADPRLVLEIALVRLARRDTGGRSRCSPTGSSDSSSASNNGPVIRTRGTDRNPRPAMKPRRPEAG